MRLFVFQKLYADSDGYDYGVHFSRDKEAYKHFSVYSKSIGDVKKKKFDVKNNWWKMSEADVSQLRIIESKCLGSKTQEPKKKIWKRVISSEPSVKLGVTPNQKVVGYKNMGVWMKLSPYDYQKETIKFCYDNPESLIVLPCGAGKSAIIIGLFGEALARKKIKGPGMIVVKASIKYQWESEVKKFSNFKPQVIRSFSDLGKKRDAFEAQFKSKADLFILNYEALRDTDIRNQMHKLHPDFVALDEAHYIKDDSTKRAKAAFEFADAKYKIASTATPVQKNPLDLYSLFKFISPTLFPKKGEFGNRYVRWTNFGGYVRRPIGSRNESELNSKISPFMFTKTKEEISKQLPKLMVLQRYCQLTEKQQQKSDELKSILHDLHDEEKAISIKLNKIGAKTSDELKQCEAKIMMYQTFAQELCDDEELLTKSDSQHALDFVTGDDSSKTSLAIDLIKEIIESGEKVAIFSRYARYQDILTERIKKEKELKSVKIAYVNGAISDKKRYKEVYEKFRDDDNYKILLMSDAGAEGISLSWCKYVIEIDLANSYAIQTQRHGRIERADSTHDTVYVYQLLCENSYDEIAQKIVNKKEKFDSSIIKGDLE